MKTQTNNTHEFTLDKSKGEGAIPKEARNYTKCELRIDWTGATEDDIMALAEKEFIRAANAYFKNIGRIPSVHKMRFADLGTRKSDPRAALAKQFTLEELMEFARQRGLDVSPAAR